MRRLRQRCLGHAANAGSKAALGDGMVGAIYVRETSRVGPIPLSTKFFQGLGALPDVFKGFGFNTFLLFFYSQVLGAPPVLVATAIALTTVLDGAVDPLIGSFSDNLKSRLGRRHPLMYASALPLALGLYLVFSPPVGLDHNGLFAWIFATTALVSIAISLFSVPWTALMAELSDDYAERTEIVVWRYAVGWIGGLAFTFSVWTFIFPATPAFPRGQLNADNYVLFAPVLAVCVGLAALVATQLTRREIPFLVQPAAASSFSLRRMIDELFSMLSNRDFLILFMGALLSACIGGTTSALEIYMSTYFWGLGSAELRWFSLAFFGAAAAFVLLPRMQLVLDKKILMLGCFGLLLLDGVVMISLRLLEVLPANGEPALLILLLANTIFRTFLGTVLGVMFISMLADSLDAQELRNGKRQEGMFAAALSFSTKATAGVGVLAGGLLLQNVIQWPVGKTTGEVDPDIVFRLGLVAGILVPLAYVAPLLVGMGYRITREAHAEIRRQVAAQRLSSFGHDPDPPAAPPTTANIPLTERTAP